jgi:hypothetical protein
MSTRPNKPNARTRAAHMLGWIVAQGRDPERAVLACVTCGEDGAPWHVAGLDGRPDRVIVLGHSTPYVDCKRYGWDVLLPMCAPCNERTGERPVHRPDAYVVDTRANEREAGAWLTRLRVEARASAS